MLNGILLPAMPASRNKIIYESGSFRFYSRLVRSLRPNFRREFRSDWGGSFRPNFKGGSFQTDFWGELFRPDLFISALFIHFSLIML